MGSEAVGPLESADEDPPESGEYEVVDGEISEEKVERTVEDVLSRTVEPRLEYFEQRLEIRAMPSPEELREYDRILPGLSETFRQQWLDESSHRRQLETKSLEGSIKFFNRGQLLAGWLGTLIFAASIGMIFTGRSLVGFIILIPLVGSLAATFLRLGPKTSELDSGGSVDPDGT